jgi:predicted nucleotidyltransferase
VISYLKYIPSKRGKWGKGSNRFQRIMRRYTMLDLINTINFLRRHPEYLYDSPVMGVSMSAVPINKITDHLKPEEKIINLSRSKDLDALQGKTLDLASKISDESGVPLEYFGVTGSILLNIHQKFSDIDLTVYGVKNSECVRETLKQIYLTGSHGILKFSGEDAKRWCLSKAENYPLTYEEAYKMLSRKWNRGIFKGTKFSIHSVKLEEEVDEKYGDKIFNPRGMIRIEAKVSDDSEADLMPSIYKVEDVRILEGQQVRDIVEVASYEGFYGGIAYKGERIAVYGKLEKVIDKRSNEEYHRVLIGSKEALGKDYIKPL